MLQYVELIAGPNATSLGEASAQALTEFFRKGLPLKTLGMIPDLKAGRFTVERTVRIWVGIEMYRSEYVALLHIRDAHPFREGNEHVVFSSEDRGGLCIFEEQFHFTYDSESKLLLHERRP
jgi:hypothetical protein